LGFGVFVDWRIWGYDVLMMRRCYSLGGGIGVLYLSFLFFLFFWLLGLKVAPVVMLVEYVMESMERAGGAL